METGLGKDAWLVLEARTRRAAPVGREKTFELAPGQGPVGLGERRGWLRRAPGPEHNRLFSRHSRER